MLGPTGRAFLFQNHARVVAAPPASLDGSGGRSFLGLEERGDTSGREGREQPPTPSDAQKRGWFSGLFSELPRASNGLAQESSEASAETPAVEPCSLVKHVTQRRREPRQGQLNQAVQVVGPPQRG